MPKWKQKLEAAAATKMLYTTWQLFTSVFQRSWLDPFSNPHYNGYRCCFMYLHFYFSMVESMTGWRHGCGQRYVNVRIFYRKKKSFWPIRGFLFYWWNQKFNRASFRKRVLKSTSLHCKGKRRIYYGIISVLFHYGD